MNGTPIASRAVSRKAAPRRSETKQLRRPAITDAGAGRANNSRHVTPDSLSQMLADFLEGARAAVVVEDGAIVFDLAESKYSISGEYHKCLLHLWSSERNLVRRVLDAEVKTTTLRLQVQRMGQNRPTRLDFCRDRDRRSPAARRAAPTSLACAGRSKEIFPAGPLSGSPPAWIWNTPSVRPTCAACCARVSAPSPSSE